MAALHPLDQPEGPAAHDRLRLTLLAILLAVLLRGGRREDHEAHPVGREHVEHERVGLLEPDLNRVGIERLDRVHRLVERAHARPGRRVHDPVDAELHRGRVERRAVVKDHVLSQLERVEEPVGGDLPRVRGARHELAVGRDAQEAAADVHRDPVQLVPGRGVEVEVGDLVAVGDAQITSALCLLRLRRRASGRRSRRGRAGGPVEPDVCAWCLSSPYRKADGQGSR